MTTDLSDVTFDPELSEGARNAIHDASSKADAQPQNFDCSLSDGVERLARLAAASRAKSERER